jgi:hypothetical protein
MDEKIHQSGYVPLEKSSMSRLSRLNAVEPGRTPASKSTSKNPNKTNGSTDHPDQTPAQTNTAAPIPTVTTVSDKKPVTVMLPDTLHRKVKITAELSGLSLSDLVEAQLKIVVKERLPGRLAALNADS